MKKKLLINVILFAVVSLFLCGCKTTQKEMEIIPIEAVSDIQYEKEELDLGDIVLKNPGKVVSDGSRLYICDSGNDRIVVWSLEDCIAEIIGNIGSADGEFISPESLAVNSKNICVLDSGNYRIQVLKKDGTFVSSVNLLDYFPRNMKVVDVELDEEGIIYLSVMLWHDDIKKSGLYAYADGSFKLMEKLAAASVCKNEANGSVCTVSLCELKNESEWKTGYAEFCIYESRKNTVKRAFSDLFSAVDIAVRNNRYYVFDDCSRSLYEFDEVGNCDRWLYEEKLPSKLVYTGFCSIGADEFCLTETTEGKVYVLTPIKGNDSE